MRSQGETLDGGPNERELRGDDDDEIGEGVEGEIDAEDEGDVGADGKAEVEADDEDGAAEDEHDEPPQQVSRRESRYQRAIREAREAREEARQLRQDFERSRYQPQPQQPDPQAQARAEQEFIERLRLMDPVDAAAAMLARKEQQFVQWAQGVEGRNIERADKSDWRASIGQNKARARLSDQVEQAIAAARARGDYQTTREVVFWTLYGQEIERRSRDAAPRQQRAAQRRVASQTTRPGSGRGEAARPGRRPAVDGDEALLRGITVGDI